MKKWILSNKKKIEKIDDVVEILLRNRNLSDKKSIDNFLNSNISNLKIENVGIDTKEFLKFKKRLYAAFNKKEKVIIFGDYDVDGICASAILWEAFYSQSKSVFPYIPERVEEGYGLSIKGIDNVLKIHPDTQLIITVDNGIVAHDAVDYAKSKNIEVIVTDHHIKHKKLPDAYCTLHTTKLCGAGIAWLLVKELGIIDEAESGELLSLAALATVADLVPLEEENRIIVKYGLQVLKKSTRVGLLKLFEKSAIDKNSIDTYKIGHVIAPRLNASGRIQNAMNALRLLCTKDVKKADALAILLENLNKSRKEITKKSVDHAKLSVIKASSSEKVIVVSDDSYNPGVIGLIASRLVEIHYKPAMAIAIDGDLAKGSARSINGVNIIELIRSVDHTLVEAGGHPMAAGFSLKTAMIEKFTEQISINAEKVISDDLLERTLKIDCLLPFELINNDLIKAIKKLEPYGMGNPEPIFATKKVIVAEVRKIGKELTHLKLKIKSQKIIFDAVAFGWGEKADINEGDFVDIAYTIDENEWNGKTAIQLKVKDIKTNRM